MNLDALLARFEAVETEADGYLVQCPAHNDSRPSLRITVSDKGKVLMRCRAGCSTADVLKAMGMSMRDLATMDPGDTRPEVVASAEDVPASPADVARLAVQLNKYAVLLDGSYGSIDAIEYAAERFGATHADIERLGLGYAEDLGGGPRLVVPFRNKDGVALGFQARALDPEASIRWLGPKNPEGANWAKVGWLPGSAGYEEVMITEGPSDGLTAAIALGFDTIAIRGAGLSANPYVVAEVVKLLGDREAVIAGDGDPAGRRFSALLAEALVARDLRVRVLDMPDGTDLNDWRKQDPGKFQGLALKAIAQAPVIKSRTAALLAWDEERYSLSDLGGARYLRDYIESLGSGVRYSEETGFYLLEDGIWRLDERQRVRTYAQAVADIVRNLAREASLEAQGSEEEGVSAKAKKRAARLNRYAAHVQTTRGIDSLLRELQAVQGVPCSIADFDGHPDLLACRNGVVDLRTGELRPHDAALLLTRRVELDYIPDAPAPRWRRFFTEVFPGDPELADYIQRLIGYGITGHTSEECFAIHWGTGANGKSVFTDTLAEVFRDFTTTTPFSTFEVRPSGGIPNDLAALKGARLVMAAEGEQGKPMAEAVLKRVTGRDLIAARFMRREFFEFRPSFLLNLATNFKPSFKGQDDGLWRRVKLIPWLRTFKPSERDHQLGARLLKESEGILAWAVQGAVQWYAHGLGDPPVIQEATREYKETSNALAGFLPGIFEADPKGGRISGKVLFEAYLDWAQEENLPQREVWTRRAFFAALEERGLSKRNARYGVAFDGIRRVRNFDKSEDPRADTAPVAHSLTTPKEPPTVAGADLSDVI